MLHRAKVLEQLKHVEHHIFSDFSSQIQEAYHIWQTIAGDVTFKHHVLAQCKQLGLPVWQDELADKIVVGTMAQPYTIVAIDGSQIFPDRHQGNSCFLLNIGTVCLRYGKHAYAVLDSQPYVFTSQDAQQDGFFYGDTTPDGVSCRRHMLELTHGCTAIKGIATQEGLQLLLFDGSLLFWHLAPKSVEVQHHFASRYMLSLEELYQRQCLVAGYISLPHSKELVSLIRFSAAQYDAEMFKNIKTFDVLLDKHIIQFYFQHNERSTVFKSNAPISCLYPDHLRPYFFYMRGQKEIIRIEIPAWIAQDQKKVDTVATLIADQMAKGNGYPISLAEAHEQAVVKGPDREFFYHILEKIGIAQKIVLAPSQKSLKKRAMSV